MDSSAAKSHRGGLQSRHGGRGGLQHALVYNHVRRIEDLYFNT